MPDSVRFAALGDSTTVGIGDPVPSGWRGWARLLADSIGHDTSFRNLAVSGATASDVRRTQLAHAVDHRPTIASLVVGVNDTMRSTWDVHRLRDDVLTCAEALHDAGAVLMTVRFHDHGAIFGLPAVLRRPLWRRIEQVNAVYDEVGRTFGGVRVDLAGQPEITGREFWSVDRLHPSELGHRTLAQAFGGQLAMRGMDVTVTPVRPEGGVVPTRWSDLRWMISQGGPWVGRRARDLGPWAARMAMAEFAAVASPACFWGDEPRGPAAP
jgi:lysophospholipase L1-like esterase